MSNDIDLTKDTLDELVSLNRRVVERIRFLSQAQCFEEMARFNLGETVSFRARDGRTILGTIARLNKKTVTVITPDGDRWKVSPALLSRTADHVEAEAPAGRLIPLSTTRGKRR